VVPGNYAEEMTVPAVAGRRQDAPVRGEIPVPERNAHRKEPGNLMYGEINKEPVQEQSSGRNV